MEQNDKPQSLEEQALYHLFQDSKDAFECYKEILKKKNDFNEKMDIFIEGIKDKLIELLKTKGRKKYEHLIDSPLRFYLVKMNNCITVENNLVDWILEQEDAYLKEGGHYNNEAWEIKDELLELIKSDWLKSTEVIKSFMIEIRELKSSVDKFQECIKPISIRQHIGLKSSCEVEEELSIKNKFNFLKRRKHSV